MKQSIPLTRAYLDQALKRMATRDDLKSLVTKKDLKPLKDDVVILKGDVGVLKSDVGVLKEDAGVLKASMVTSDDLDKATDEIRKNFAVLQSSVDGFMGKTRKTADELSVLRHGHNRLQGLLVKKQVITEDEIAVG